LLVVTNDYFGGNIKVAGLITGADLSRAIESVGDSVTLLLPDVCLSEGRFLDGMMLEELPRRVTTVRTTGQDLRTTLERIRSQRLVRS
jgi:NifB/MoaA-like Fe-S oxidoreductase